MGKSVARLTFGKQPAIQPFSGSGAGQAGLRIFHREMADQAHPVAVGDPLRCGAGASLPIWSTGPKDT